MYQKAEGKVQAVIHVHSFYSVLWSCLPHKGEEDDVIPAYTPYLGMKLGKVRLVSYEKPGSEELFSEFSRRTGKENGYLLAHHGPVAGGDSLMDAFFNLEELEESARIAWELRGCLLYTSRNQFFYFTVYIIDFSCDIIHMCTDEVHTIFLGISHLVSFNGFKMCIRDRS